MCPLTVGNRHVLTVSNNSFFSGKPLLVIPNAVLSLGYLLIRVESLQSVVTKLMKNQIWDCVGSNLYGLLVFKCQCPSVKFNIDNDII